MYRKAAFTDIEFVFKLFMHPQINPHLLYEQMDIKAFKPIFDELIVEDIFYIFEENNKSLGMFKLVPYSYRSAHVAYLGSFAIDPAFVGKGFGTKMLITVIELAKSTGIKRIELSAGLLNKKAIMLYKKCGFKEEGILKKLTYLKSAGKYIDELKMSYIIE